MSTPDFENILSVNFKSFPYHLIIPNVDNLIILNMLNHSENLENFKFTFERENLDVNIPEEFSKEVKIKPKETKEIPLQLTPTTDGFGNLSITIDWMEEIEYTVKVQKVRDTIHKSIINTTFEKNSLKPIESLESFDPEKYFLNLSNKDLKEKRKKIEQMKRDFELKKQILEKKKLKNQESEEEVSKLEPPKISLGEIEERIKTLAKGYLSIENLQKALELLKQLSDEQERRTLTFNFLKAYAIKNFEDFFKYLQNIENIKLRNKLVESVVLILVEQDKDNSIKVVDIFSEERGRNELLKTIILRIVGEDPEKAYTFSKKVTNDILRLELLFTVSNQYYRKGEKPKVFNTLREIIDIILKQDQQEIRSNSFKNNYYLFLKDALSGIAEIENPQLSDTLIRQIEDQMLIKKLTVDLFDLIYKMVDEVRTKVEPKTVFSQLYQFNIYRSNITNELQGFAQVGGNISSNVLNKQTNYRSAFLSLFSFEFSIFPTFDRLYNDLLNAQGENICYYIFPSIDNHSEEEENIMKTTLNQFLVNTNQAGNLEYIFNVDFIPYLGTPTVIMSSESYREEDIKIEINAQFGDRLQFLTKESIFEGGKTVEMLKEVFYSNQFKIVNLVFSYEFLNDYPIFYEFVKFLNQLI
ncbi:MAG: putative Tetratricopeptide domain protein [Promethearchaeota archaeon]|nr:MAG: putative Tetratricopeptide domain protein [Candidatus Lokiarchaeota archaeon]